MKRMVAAQNEFDLSRGIKNFLFVIKLRETPYSHLIYDETRKILCQREKFVQQCPLSRFQSREHLMLFTIAHSIDQLKDAYQNKRKRD